MDTVAGLHFVFVISWRFLTSGSQCRLQADCQGAVERGAPPSRLLIQRASCTGTQEGLVLGGRAVVSARLVLLQEVVGFPLRPGNVSRETPFVSGSELNTIWGKRSPSLQCEEPNLLLLAPVCISNPALFQMHNTWAQIRGEGKEILFCSVV